MLIHIKTTYRCDSCHKVEDWIMGNEYCSNTGAWGIRKEIFQTIEYEVKPGWVRDDFQNHWCPDCHMKKPIKKVE